MESFLENLNTRKESSNLIWKTFCDKNKSSVKIISRNGISTKKDKYSITKLKNNVTPFLDNDVNNFIRNATDEIFQSPEKINFIRDLDESIKSNGMTNDNKIVSSSCHKVVTLKLNPADRENSIVDLTPKNDISFLPELPLVCAPSEEQHEVQQSTVQLHHKEDTNDKLENLDCVKNVHDVKTNDTIDTNDSRCSDLDITIKLRELFEKIMCNLEDIKSGLYCNVEKYDEIELIKQKKRSVEFGIRFARNHLYQVNRLIEDMQSSRFNKNMKTKIISLYTLILQATIAYIKGTVNHTCNYLYEKLQDLLQIIVKSMKLEHFFNNDDLLLVMAQNINQLCMDLNDDLEKTKDLCYRPLHKKPLKEPKTKKAELSIKKINLRKSSGKPSKLSMYKTETKKTKPKVQNKHKKSLKSLDPKPLEQVLDVNTKMPEITTQENLEVLKENSVDHDNQLDINTKFQEALHDIVREMTKQQMQQIFRPVFNDVEMMMKNKVPKDEYATEMLKRINTLLILESTSSKGQQNTDDDIKSTENWTDRRAVAKSVREKLVQNTCEETVYKSSSQQKNKHERQNNLRQCIQKGKLENLHETSNDPMYGNGTFQKPWNVISRISDKILVDLTESIIKNEVLQDIDAFVTGFLKLEVHNHSK